MKVTGPAFSLAASGTIGGMITASRWKGRAYFRTRVTPHNPRSPGQVAGRAMFSFLSRAWSAIGSTNQNTWNDLAAATNISPFNAYQKFNMDRWTHVEEPWQDPTGASATTPPLPGAAVATAGVKQISVTTSFAMDANAWGAIVFAKKGSAPTGVKSEVVYVAITEDSLFPIFVHTGLTTGDTWYYKWQVFGLAGALGALGAEGHATVL
jgi:hypothetical protein